MSKVNIAEAKVRLSSFVDAALEGEEVIICRRDRPLVKLVPVPPVARGTKIGRRIGRGRIGPDFDAPLEDFEPYVR